MGSTVTGRECSAGAVVILNDLLAVARDLIRLGLPAASWAVGHVTADQSRRNEAVNMVNIIFFHVFT